MDRFESKDPHWAYKYEKRSSMFVDTLLACFGFAAFMLSVIFIFSFGD